MMVHDAFRSISIVDLSGLALVTHDPCCLQSHPRCIYTEPFVEQVGTRGYKIVISRFAEFPF